MNEQHDLFMPLHTMRPWGETYDFAESRNISIAEIEGIPTSVGYVPIYSSIADLVREHGDVDYMVLRRRTLRGGDV